MLRGRQLTAFQKSLLGWFRQYQRDLPWRRTKDPYRIWLSEIMLQQTRVAAVIPYYERFLVRFPDVQALAAAPQDGIGRYTAAAILSIAYGAKHAVLDGNVARVLARIFAVQGDLRDAKHWQSLQRSADSLLDSSSPSDWNQAMMELGATLCTPQSPQCLLCPVTQFCQARKLGIAESLPARRKKRATEVITLAAAVLLDSRGRTLLLSPPKLSQHGATQRRAQLAKSASSAIPAPDQISVLLSKLWHFPTIAVRTDPIAELKEHLAKILPAAMAKEMLQIEALPTTRHAVTYRAITLRPFRVTVAQLPRIPNAKTISLAEIMSPSSLAISNLTRKAARAALASPAALSART